MTSKDDKIGYKNPPKHTQFKPGQSGNPSGRPKGVKNLATDLKEELEEKIVITEANRTHQVTKQRAMIKTLFAKALKGDARAANVLIKLIVGLDQNEKELSSTVDLSKEDQEILTIFHENYLKDTKNGGQGETS